MKLLMIYTGGTISSKLNSDGVIELNNRESYILEKYKEKYDTNEIEFISCNPYNIFSENLNIHYFEILIECLKCYNLDEFDGVILFHGTDTLSYTANFLGIYLGNIGIPFVIVSSNYELTDYRSNGISNLHAAIEFIKCSIPGVFVTYKQNNMNIVHLGTRILQARHFTNDFYSYNDVPFGYMIDGKFKINESKDNVKIQDIFLKGSMFKENSTIKFVNNVRLFKPDISIEYSNVSINNINAIVHSTYHSGTLNYGNDSNYSIETLLERCNTNNIPFFIAPITSEQERHIYVTLKSAIDKGIVPLINISAEAAYCKALILVQYNYDSEKLKEIMKEDIFFECKN